MCGTAHWHRSNRPPTQTMANPPRVPNAGLHRVEFQDGEEFSKSTIADYAPYKKSICREGQGGSKIL
jgi:hypothetical protein